ncbi:multidrug resistance efflux pump [Salmonella enterica subsp. enterica]|uniref:Multidrug resistance efflux pump n=1 Tax=Salmonella enterica I TaxID=59201 RepID=A0A379UPA2_SALET|nr:multidrug resistance efflux pump [Salmonella enterica subsp. enterica]
MLKRCRASVDVALATLKQAQWQLSQTEVKAPVSGWVTNLSTRTGDYASTGKPLFALVDSHSFYVMGYFEETKLRHIREGEPALITLYSGNVKLQGHVGSIGPRYLRPKRGKRLRFSARYQTQRTVGTSGARVPVRIDLTLCRRISRSSPALPAA